MKGKKLNKVGLIDSGIAADYQYGRIKYIQFSNEDVYDSTGHGTLCASMILRMNPNAEIYSVKALDSHTSCSSDKLLEILDLFVDIEVDIINMSLSTQDLTRIDDYSKVCNNLMKQGKILIASLSNLGTNSLPAMLPSVIGVGGCDTLFDNDFIFFNSNKIECFFDSKPVLLKNIFDEYELFGGNSKACAALSGLLSSMEIQTNNNKVNTVREMLSKISMEKLKFVKKNTSHFKGYDKLDQLRIENIVKRIIEREVEDKKPIYEQFSTSIDAIKIIKALEGEFGVNVNYSSVNLYDFTSSLSLLQLIYNKKI